MIDNSIAIGDFKEKCISGAISVKRFYESGRKKASICLTLARALPRRNPGGGGGPPYNKL